MSSLTPMNVASSSSTWPPFAAVDTSAIATAATGQQVCSLPFFLGGGVFVPVSQPVASNSQVALGTVLSVM